MKILVSLLSFVLLPGILSAEEKARMKVVVVERDAVEHSEKRTCQFKVRFKATASGDDISVRWSASNDDDDPVGLVYQIRNAQDGKVVSDSKIEMVTELLSCSQNGAKHEGFITVQDGDTVVVCLDVVFTPKEAGWYYLQLVEMRVGKGLSDHEEAKNIEQKISVITPAIYVPAP